MFGDNDLSPRSTFSISCRNQRTVNLQQYNLWYFCL